jgi:IMP dehydrogenase
MTALSFDDVTLLPRFNNIPSRERVDTSVKFGDLLLKAPVFSANMDTVTASQMAEEMWELGGMGFLHRFCSIEDNIEMYKESCFRQRNTREMKMLGVREAVVSLGVNEGLKRYTALHEIGARYFCIDIAHGHSESVGDMIQAIKDDDPSVFVVAGNVCTGAGAEYLAARGADAVKVGIGPGSVCTTRLKSGFGLPQFSAILDCRKVNVFLIADGGIRHPGDAVKALAAGADAIMCGGMFAGCDETPGDFEDEPIWETASPAGFQSRQVKVYRGMASDEAQDDFGVNSDWKTAEGIKMKVRARGPVANVVSDIMGGIRSGMTYCGANNLRQIRERASWVDISAAGAAEGRAHGEDRL